MTLPLLVSLTVAACGGEEDTGVTYDDDVEPIFFQRCTTCHHAGSPIKVDIENPFNPETGLVYSENSWAKSDAYPGETDALNVVPGDPDSSFLMDKITDRGTNTSLPANGHGGSAMPAQLVLQPDEVTALVDWVTRGAPNDAAYLNDVKPIFGTGDGVNGKCAFCHYPGSPNPGLDLTDPFGPNGLVNVDATYRGDIKRVLPGDPDNSLLIKKINATQPDSDIGAPMPYSFEYLTDNQINTVRQWIVEGAKP